MVVKARMADEARQAVLGIPETTYVLEAGSTVFLGLHTLRISELEVIATWFETIDLALAPINGLQIRPAHNHRVVMSAEQAAELCSALNRESPVPRITGHGGARCGCSRILRHSRTPAGTSRAGASLPNS
jgi:hypothetical protein